MTVSEDNEKNEKQRMDLFYAYLKQRYDANDVDSPKAINEILHEAERWRDSFINKITIKSTIYLSLN